MKNKIYFLKFISIVTALLIFSGCTQREPSIKEVPESNYLIPLVEEHDRSFTYAGNPVPLTYPNPIREFTNTGFITGYDEIRGVPAWVAYRTFHLEEYTTFTRPSRFLIDRRTENQLSHDEYTHSGYDRGHMAPNYAIVSRFGREAQRETFYMTNIIPQKPKLNRQWWQRLERVIARDYSEKYDEVWVLVGPVYKETGNWLNEKIKIPSHNFKIIKTEHEGNLKVKAFLVPQDVQGSDSHESYLTTINEIEELTGLDFNPLLKRVYADSIESIKSDSMW